MENARVDGKPDMLLLNLRTIGTHHCDQTVGEEAAEEIEALRAEVERLNRILWRIVEGDVDSTTAIRVGADAFAAAREYLMRDQGGGLSND